MIYKDTKTAEKNCWYVFLLQVLAQERFALNKPHESLLRVSDHIERAPTGHPSASVAVADR
jgi:hypothetical protein